MRCSRPSHIPYLSGTDCSSCHAANYAAGGFGPTSMSAAKHAFVPTACDTCHEAGLSFYMGASTPRCRAAPRITCSERQSAAESGDCSGCHETDRLEHHHHAGRAYAEPRQPGLRGLPHGDQRHAASYATLASIAVLHTGISTGCAQCHGATAQLTFYNNNDNPKDGGSHAAAHPLFARHRLQHLPRRELCRRRLRPDEHECRQACLRAHDLRYLP